MQTQKGTQPLKETKPRILTVQPQLRHNRYSSTHFPEIRLRGNWLGKLGFSAYSKIKVQGTPKFLVISVEE
ncbi:MAG: type I addiction module toxin, SymE family [Proteobacteria bacterium]|nr:MAG: type I addiction module toxin, SymE family [Pseudomonadota bacterium]